MNSNQIKIVAASIVLILAFAFGRYSIRSSLEKEHTSEIERTKSEYTEKLSQLEKSHEQELTELKTKMTEMEKVTVIDKNGNTTITERTKTKEKSKSKGKVVDKESTKEQVKVVVETKEVIKEVTRIVPPPSWRVYASAAALDVAKPKELSYGGGTMYDLGPLNVGGYGLYSPKTEKTAFGLTVGVSF